MNQRETKRNREKGVEHWIEFPSNHSNIKSRFSVPDPAPEYFDTDDSDELDEMAFRGRHKSRQLNTPNYTFGSKLTQFEPFQLNSAREISNNELIQIDWGDIPIPRRFIPHIPIDKLRRMQTIILSNGDAEPLLENTKSVVIFHSAMDIPQARSSLQRRLSPGDLNGNKESHVWLQMCITALVPKVQWDWTQKEYLNPFSLLEQRGCPIISTVLNTKLFRSPVKLSILHTKELLVDSHTRYPLESVRFDDQTMKIEGKFAVSFRMNSEEEVENWKICINDVLQDRSKLFIELCIRYVASYANTKTPAGEVIAAICSPYLLFTISLLNEGINNHIFSILAAHNMLDFFVRCLVMSELNLSLSFDDLYSDDHEYSSALVSLFLSVSESWTDNTLSLLEKNNVTSGLDVLNILYSVISSIDSRGFYIIRLVTVLAYVKYPLHVCPAIALFRFISKCLAKVRKEQANVQQAFRDLEILLESQPYEHMLLLMVAPFVQKIVDTVPVVPNDDSDISEKAIDLREQIIEKADIMTDQISEMMEKDPADHPLARCYAECVSLNVKNQQI